MKASKQKKDNMSGTTVQGLTKSKSNPKKINEHQGSNDNKVGNSKSNDNSTRNQKQQALNDSFTRNSNTQDQNYVQDNNNGKSQDNRENEIPDNIHNNPIESNSNQRETNTNDKLQIPNFTKEEIRLNSKILFLNFSTYSIKENENFISQKSVIKMLRYNNLIPNSTMWLSQIDILFKTITPHSIKLSYDQFLTFLLKLTEQLYPNEYKSNPREAINCFLGNLFYNYNYILNEEPIPMESIADPWCPYKAIETVLNYKPDDNQIYLINKTIFTIYEIYIKYFVNELENSEDLAKKSFTNLLNFSRDFEVQPYIINESQIYSYYSLTILNNSIFVINQENNEGLNFTWNHFCLFLIHMSLISYAKTIPSIDSSVDTEVNKWVMFFERLETSRGMRTFTRKLNRPSANKLSLLPSKEVFVKLGALTQEDVINLSKKTTHFNKENKDIANINNNTSQEIIHDNKVMRIINDNIDGWEKTFLYFGRIGDKLNFNQMSWSSYMKFLKHCNLMKEINVQERKQCEELRKGIQEKMSVAYLHDRKSKNIHTLQGEAKVKWTEQEREYKKKITNVVNATYNEAVIDEDEMKLGESDVNIIFSHWTGPRNFDNPELTRSHFDKNKGYCSSFGYNPTNQAKISKHFNKIETTSNPQNNARWGRMNFKTFIKSFEWIGLRLYPNADMNTVWDKILNENIFPNLIVGDIGNSSTNNNSLSNIDISYSNMSMNRIQVTFDKILGNDEIQNFLKRFSEYITIYYKYHADEHTNNINFKGLFEFYKSFSLFPDIINLIQLKNIFSFFSEINQKWENENNKHNQELSKYDWYEDKNNYMTFTDFWYSLAITALNFDFDETFRDIDKLLYLIERWNQSNGVKKWQLQTGRTYTKSKDIVAFLWSMKNEYPEFYKLNKENVEDQSFIKNKTMKGYNNNMYSLDNIYGDDEEGYYDREGGDGEGEGEGEEEGGDGDEIVS